MYSTPGEVRLALAPVLAEVDLQDTPAVMGDGQIEDEIRGADSRIDSYIGARYATPVQPVDSSDPPTYPTQVAVWSRNLAAYSLTLTLYRNRPMEPTNPAFLRYQQVMSDLAAVQRGTAVLNLPPAVTGNTGGTAGVVDTAPAGLFGPSDYGAPPRPGWATPWPGSDPELARYGWS